MEQFMQWLLIQWGRLVDGVQAGFDQAADWWQWGAIVVTAALAYPLAKLLGKTLLCPDKAFRKACMRFLGLPREISGYPFTISLLAWITYGIFVAVDYPGGIVYKFAYISTAWAIYSFARHIMKGLFVPRFVATLIFASVLLELFGQRQAFIDFLIVHELKLGGLSINVYKVLAGIVCLTVLTWFFGLLASAASRSLERRSNIAPSTRVLMSKIFRVIAVTLAVLVALPIAGFELTHLAVFSGALGIGLGFGLQKVISNFVSGIILLMDKSIKPGDVIEIEDTFGWINSIRSRYVSVITRDRKEHLIPNEDLITNRVINWSFSDTFIRVKADFGVTYNADPHEVRDFCLAAVKKVPRILEFPEPVCLLTGFGDSSVDFQMRFWINDPKEGVGNLRSAVLFAIWDALKENGVEIPFPQRDLHLRSVSAESASKLHSTEIPPEISQAIAEEEVPGPDGT